MSNYDPLYFEYKLLYDTDHLSKYEIYHEEVISGHGTFPQGTSNPNGRVYFGALEPSEVRVLEVDPESLMVNYLTDPLVGSTVTYKTYDAVTASNGKSYLTPGGNYDRCIIYDPKSSTFSGIIDNAFNNNRYMAACVGGDGRIYMPPRNGTTVGIIDPDTDTLSATNYGLSIPSTSNKYNQAVLHSNGKIYCAPINNIQMLIIDTINQTAEYLPNFSNNTSYTWGNITIDPEGNLITFVGGLVYKYNISSGTTEEISTPESTGYTMGWGTAAHLPNGMVSCIGRSSNTTSLFIVDSIKGVLSQKIDMPIHDESTRYVVAGNGDIVVTIPNYGVLFLRNGLRTQVPHNIHYSKFGK